MQKYGIHKFFVLKKQNNIVKIVSALLKMTMPSRTITFIVAVTLYTSLYLYIEQRRYQNASDYLVHYGGS